MVKLTFVLRRAPHLSREEFQRYWREQHAPLVAKHRETLEIRRYVQLHTLETPLNAGLQRTRGGPDAYDGVAEIWLDSLDWPQTEAAQAAGLELLEDERRFIDLANSPIFVGEEHVVLEV